MKCPKCGKWNRATLPRCFHCGEPLEAQGFYAGAPDPDWKTELKDKEKPKAYIRVDDYGEAESSLDPRDALAMEMADLKTRKLQGEIQQRRLRKSAAERGMAPSGLTVRTTSNRGTFFSAYDNPDTTLRPVDPALVEEGEIEEDAQIVYTEKYRSSQGEAPRPRGSSYDYGFTQRIMNTAEPLEDQPVYDGYHDTSSYIPSHSRQDEYAHSLRMRPTGTWKPRRFGFRRLLRNLLIVAVIFAVGWIGYTVVLPMLNAQESASAADVTITPTIRGDLAAHTITIPGEDGQRITIRELRTSAIVIGGVATFDILDHIWYDNFEDYLQETMTVTLTPYLLTDSGKQTPLKPISYDIDIPLSKIELSTPDAPYKTISTAMYNIIFYVLEGSKVTINGQDYSDLVNSEDGKVSYNATVQPIGENNYTIVVRSQYYRENSMTVTLYREKQDIPLDLASDIASSTTNSTLEVRAATLPGAVVKVLSPYRDLDITSTDVDGSFTFNAVFEQIGNNTIIISADYPGKKTTIVEHVVYYVPNIDVYSRKARGISLEYNDLVNNIERHKEVSRIYVGKGKITSIETSKPQRAFMNCGTEESPLIVYIENSSRTTWVEGATYQIYGDAYGMYDSKPWLVVRYTYSEGEY